MVYEISVLNSESMRKGRDNFLIFNILISISAACLSPDMISVFAINIGASEYVILLMGVISNLAYVGLLGGRWLIKKYGATGMLFRCLNFRTLGTIVILLSPFFNSISHSLSIFMILFGIAISSFATLSGNLAGSPIYHEITNRDKQDVYFSTVTFYNSVIGSVGAVAIVFLTRGTNGILIYQQLGAVSIVFCIISSFFIYQTPESSTPKNAAQVPLKDTLVEILKNNDLKKMLMASTALLATFTVFLPITILFLKKYYILDDNKVFTLIVFQMIGLSVGAQLSKRLLPKMGARNFSILSYCFCMFVILLWAFSPSKYSLFYMAVVFLFEGIAMTSSGMGMFQYYQKIVPKQKIVNMGLVRNMVSGIGSGLIGGAISSLLFAVLKSISLDVGNLYFWYFTMTFCLSFVGLYSMVKLRSVE